MWLSRLDTIVTLLFFLGLVLQCCINNLCCRFVVFGGLPAVWCSRPGQLGVFL